MRYAPSVVLLMMTVCIPMAALAHQPRLVAGDHIRVNRPEISQAFYAELQGRPQTYLIAADRPFELFLRLTVPKLPRARTDFLVTIFRDSRRLQQIYGDAAGWQPFYEPFAGDYYLSGPEYKVAGAPPGQYRIVVSSPDNRGKYVLAIGTVESFTLADWLHTLAVLPSIKAYMGKSPLTAYWNLIGITLLAPLLILVAVIVLLISRARRRRHLRVTRQES